MTKTDNPRELRAIAQRIEMECDTIIRHGLGAMPAEDQADTIALINDRLALADHILATVRDDDGEEQPTVTVSGIGTVSGGGIMVRACKKPSCTWVSIDSGGDCVALSFRTFRDLCRGLGIEVPG